MVAGITTEVCVCVVFPDLRMLDEGHEVPVVTDASVTFTKIGDDAVPRSVAWSRPAP
ncbi:cysteine hydrolase family protein [Streptomyces bambusae]|uniref:hypothetical protein n=1 Tax=Streptomyces bambusae TaxID=1550616 RepID=UPI0027E03066|nr:hypothetical protein [Streptomyces bambusae]